MNAYLVLSVDDVRQLLDYAKMRSRKAYGKVTGKACVSLVTTVNTDSKGNNQISSSDLMRDVLLNS